MQRRVDPAPRGSGVRTICHTLPAELAERLRVFAFDHRVSESAILEYAFVTLLQSGADEARLAAAMRDAGYGLRRKT
ncbi:MAG: hypothetical protein NVSMB19_21300 [Vulcanimicrobiaceae bacterium]